MVPSAAEDWDPTEIATAVASRCVPTAIRNGVAEAEVEEEGLEMAEGETGVEEAGGITTMIVRGDMTVPLAGAVSEGEIGREEEATVAAEEIGMRGGTVEEAMETPAGDAALLPAPLLVRTTVHRAAGPLPEAATTERDRASVPA